jgi:hypothetical protein
LKQRIFSYADSQALFLINVTLPEDLWGAMEDRSEIVELTQRWKNLGRFRMKRRR